jgi:hypothetical protein
VAGFKRGVEKPQLCNKRENSAAGETLRRFSRLNNTWTVTPTSLLDF